MFNCSQTLDLAIRYLLFFSSCVLVNSIAITIVIYGLVYVKVMCLCVLVLFQLHMEEFEMP